MVDSIIQIKRIIDFHLGPVGLIAVALLLTLWVISWTVVPFLILHIRNQNKQQTKALTFLAKVLGGNRDDLL